jgi:glycosyltransferase involved in cell wall biosynthesis
VVPNGIDTTMFAPSHASTRKGAVLFTGMMSYEPNVDAVYYFVTEVLPLIRGAVPHAQLDVVGMNPPPRIAALSSPSVIVHGQVPDVRPFQEEAEVVVVPVRRGGGTRLKVLEAAACGKAIVSTTLGIEGLEFQAGRDLMVADSPAAFADAVVTLLRDTTLRAQLGIRARDVACRYDWTAIGERFRSLVEETATGRSPRSASPMSGQR